MHDALRTAVAVLLLAPAAAAAQARTPSAERALDFWRRFGDPTLVRLIERGLDANHDLRAAAARVDAARAVRFRTSLDLAPQITAVGGYSRQQLSSATFPGASASLPDQELWDVGAEVGWELDVFGRTRRSVQARNALVAAAREDVGTVQLLVAGELAAAWFDLRGAQHRLAVAERNAQNQQRTLELTLNRLEAGRGTALDSERAQAQLSSTLAVIPSLETAITATEQRIAVLLGVRPDSVRGWLSGDGEPVALPESLDVAVSEPMIQRRPDVRSAERRVVASSAFTGAAKSEYLPRVSIRGAAGYMATTFDALGQSGTPRYAIGPVVTWPLLDLGRVKAGVDEAQAAEAEAEAQYQQAVLRARGEAETALVAYRKSIERLHHLENAAGASERATELALLRFTEGASDFLQVLDAERTQLEAQDRLSQGRIEASAALVDVYRTSGGALTGGRW